MKSNNIKYSALVLLAIVVSACGLLKPYDRPKMDESKNFRSDSVNSDSNGLANVVWSQFFTDSILGQHIKTGLANNFDVLKAQQQLNIAGAGFKQARAGLLPNINAELSAGKSGISEKSFNGQALPPNTSFSDVQLGASFAWEIDVWGRLGSIRRAAQANYMYSENVQRLIKSQLVSGIAENYFTLQALEAQRKVLEATIKNRQEGVTTILALKSGGLVSEVAVKQNEALLYTAQSLLIDVRREIKLRENALLVLLASNPDSIARANFDSTFAMMKSPEGLPIQLLSNRPDVMAAENQLMAAFQLNNAAQASFYPRLSILASGGLNSQNFNDLFSANALFANAFGNLTQPIFNQRQLRTQKEIRSAEQEIALINYKQSVLVAYREVSDALFNLQTNLEKLKVQRQELNALLKAVTFSEELQKQGFANYLEVLRAKDNTLSVQLSIINTQLAANLARVRLYRSVGGGWKE